MGLLKFLQCIKGKFLKETAVNAKIKLLLFRNETDKNAPLFQIQVELSQGKIDTLREYADEKVARNEYKEILTGIKDKPIFF